ncbi:23S rRNA pseudouridylate synthase B [Escherichia coli]|uniref:23S rRNA pseudouridylate synthase B n=1 Tax=Escherichia coli TaxID=562 RepID=A0A376RKQ7_ECOLX|nr:23S rRNA pseudouridylate synthase B [Escherichia coli]
MSEKLQKVLARAGHGSRREIESIIEAGRVSVDGKIAKLGDRVEVTPGLKIRIDGHLISVRESAEQICRVLAYYNRKVSCVPVTIRKGVRRCLTVCQSCVAHAGLP